MKKTSVILVLILSCIWGYTSWYWYTCKIKGICSLQRIEQLPQDVSSNIEKDIPQETTALGAPGGVIVKSNDVKQIVQLSETAQSQDTGDISAEKKEESLEEIQEIEVCKDIILDPIKVGEENSKSQVLQLEQFLNVTQGENLVEDGIYQESDLEAVKRFQLKYKKDILDPWDIEIPTGYVYKTTIQKINDIHCNN